jgi:hypothetical protein
MKNLKIIGISGENIKIQMEASVDFINYLINKDNVSYDKRFTDKLKEVRPDWFKKTTKGKASKLTQQKKKNIMKLVESDALTTMKEKRSAAAKKAHKTMKKRYGENYGKKIAKKAWKTRKSKA